MDINKCEQTISEINKFSEELLNKGKPIEDERLEIFEKTNSFILPMDFKYFMKKNNGLSLNGTLVYGIDKELRGSSLDVVYNFEHFEVSNKMPSFFVPFSPDGRGNHYCLDLTRISNDTCPIVFWQWDFVYENINDIETCNIDFIEWVKEVLINWTLEDYDYDGSEK